MIISDVRYYKANSPVMPYLVKAQNYANFSSKRPQKTRIKRFFRCFSPYFAHILASKKISIPTQMEGYLLRNGHSDGRKWG